MKFRYLVALLLAACLITPAFATIYKWTDGTGQVHYTDDAKTIPEAYRESAKDFDQMEKQGSATYDPALDRAPSNSGDGEPFWKRFLRQEEAQASASKQPKITLYMADW